MGSDPRANQLPGVTIYRLPPPMQPIHGCLGPCSRWPMATKGVGGGDHFHLLGLVGTGPEHLREGEPPTQACFAVHHQQQHGDNGTVTGGMASFLIDLCCLSEDSERHIAVLYRSSNNGILDNLARRLLRFLPRPAKRQLKCGRGANQLAWATKRRPHPPQGTYQHLPPIICSIDPSSCRSEPSVAAPSDEEAHLQVGGSIFGLGDFKSPLACCSQDGPEVVAIRNNTPSTG